MNDVLSADERETMIGTSFVAAMSPALRIAMALKGVALAVLLSSPTALRKVMQESQKGAKDGSKR